MERIGNKVSYIRKPMAKFGFVCAGLSAAAVLFCAAALLVSVRAGGNGALLVAALGLSSILTSLSAGAYGVFSFFEKERNHLLSKIGLAVAGVQLFAWGLILLRG